MTGLGREEPVYHGPKIDQLLGLGTARRVLPETFF